jgi:GAF domain-containing protein
VDVMADDRDARIAQLEAENAALRADNAALVAERSSAQDDRATTAEILRVITTSPADAQPVLDAIVQSASRLSDSPRVALWVADGDEVRKVAVTGDDEIGVHPVGFRTSATGRSPSEAAFVEARTVHVPDMSDPGLRRRYPEAAEIGARARLCVPLVQHGKSIGLLILTRESARAYAPREIALVETFADQAVIAIENARLFEELQESNRQVIEALDRQIALAEILRVIAGSPGDGNAALQTITDTVLRLVSTDSASIRMVAGDEVVILAHSGRSVVEGATRPVIGWRRSLADQAPSGEALREVRTVHVADAQSAEMLERYPDTYRGLQRTMLHVPLKRDGQAIGIISLARLHVQSFTPSEVALIETFADQAVIAIENARLFSELEQRNADLQESNRQVTEALEQQTATSEILRVIATSPTDAQPVLDAIAESAVRLSRSIGGTVGIREGGFNRIVARSSHGVGYAPGTLLDLSEVHPGHIATLEGRTIHIPDRSTPEFRAQFPKARASATASLHLPLNGQTGCIGNITVGRDVAEPYSDRDIALLETFADQAVIAIENARLFEELERRNRGLGEALEQQTAQSEVLHVIASSPANLPRVLQALEQDAGRLLEAAGGLIYRVHDGVIRRVAGPHDDAGAAPYEYGTSQRFIDPKIDACRSTWIGPINGLVVPFIARQDGDDIVLKGRRPEGLPIKWWFSDVTRGRFRWQNAVSRDDGQTWGTVQEMRGRRQTQAGVALNE